MKKIKILLILPILLLTLVSCSNDEDDFNNDSNEYKIELEMSFSYDLYTIYATYFGDSNTFFKRFEDSNDKSAYFEDSKTMTAEGIVGVTLETYTSVDTRTINVKIINVGSGRTVANEIINTPMNHRGDKQKLQIKYDIDKNELTKEYKALREDF